MPFHVNLTGYEAGGHPERARPTSLGRTGKGSSKKASFFFGSNRRFQGENEKDRKTSIA